MNKCELEGQVYTVPSVKLLRMKHGTISVCKYVLAVNDDNSFDSSNPNNRVDFIECVAFGECADIMQNKYEKGTTAKVIGKMKNHRFEDINKTIHFTNVFLTEQVENFICPKDDSLKYEDLFQKICDEGFLCIDEADYYHLATMF